MKRYDFTWLRRAVYGLLLTALTCLATLEIIELPAISPAARSLDRQLLDARLRASVAPMATEVVIVDIDEQSLAQLGRWPWSRQTLAQLVSKLASQSQVLALDVLFAEHDDSPQEDAALQAAIAQGQVVLGYYLSSDRAGQRAGQLPAPIMQAASIESLGVQITDWNGYGANLPKLQAAAKGAGFFNALIDEDGVVRAIPMLARLEGNVYESMVLATLRLALGGARLNLGADTLSLVGPRGQLQLPLSDGLVSIVPMASNIGSQRFQYISAADVLGGKASPELWKNKVVLLGSSAPGLTDLRSTAVSKTLPGVEIHATMLAAALQSVNASQQPGATPPAFLVRNDAGKHTAAALILTLGVVLSILLPMIGATGILLACVVSVVVIFGFSAMAYSNLGLIKPVAMGLGLVGALGAINLALGYLLEGRARRAVAELFGEYVSPGLVQQMTREPERYRSMRSETRELTIMFADIRGFTRIAETMPPDELREFINQYLTRMTELIHQHGGTVDKYIGDAVMAFWGAPIDDPMHADHAVSAAMAMVHAANELSVKYQHRGWPALSIGVGINTGACRVGDMGSNTRRAYTVLGDAVNLAARIEGLTKHFRLPVIVGAGTKAAARAHTFSEVGLVNVAGRVEPVRVFLPTALGVTLPLHHDALPTHTEPADATARIGL